jgi:hypothetical protein
MVTTTITLTIAPEIVDQIRFILEKIFKEGQHWVKSVELSDWRRVRYASSRGRRSPGAGPSISHVVEDIQPLLGYLEKEASQQTGATHNYVLLKPENGCLTENGIALFRPVLKKNFDKLPQLNFHIWFHCMPSGSTNDHLMTGWRFEEPEGGGSTHNYYHAQPLRKFGPEEKSHGMHDRFSERFPTFPLPAADTVELCLNALLVACGKETLRSLVRNSGNSEVRKAANVFWTKIFSTEPAGDVEPAEST